jgi:hypothetical protein
MGNRVVGSLWNLECSERNAGAITDVSRFLYSINAKETHPMTTQVMVNMTFHSATRASRYATQSSSNSTTDPAKECADTGDGEYCPVGVPGDRLILMADS